MVFIGSGKLGIPENALLALAMGCDMVNVARTAMFSIGCIQAQRCHTGRCPSGVATQSAWLQHGLDPALKSVRCANYLATLRFELLCLARACGYVHPALVPLDAIELLDVDSKSGASRRVVRLPGPAGACPARRTSKRSRSSCPASDRRTAR